jgi:1-deoxy-D-xylulose-5-phosphate synthase
MAPKDEAELQRMIVTGINHTVRSRHPRGNGWCALMEDGWEELPIGKR